jgi:hypothetical protein
MKTKPPPSLFARLFEPNRGQAESNIDFLARGNGYTAFFEGNKTVLVIPQNKSRYERVPAAPSLVSMELLDSGSQVSSEGTDLLPGTSNYFVGSDRNQWRSGVPQYAKVKFRSVYPGVDLIYYGTEGGLEYDFLLSPGARPQDIRFRVSGADKVELDDAGNLSLAVADGRIALRCPTIYQEIAGIRHQVSGRFVWRGSDEIGLSIGDYDHSRTLVVDPVLIYSTLIGANDSTQVQGVAVDSSGEIFITGTTFSTNYPVVNAFQSTNHGTTNVFITKLNAAGNTILYSTYIGDSGFDNGRGITTDSAGNAYVTGEYQFAGFPTTSGAYITSCSSNCGGD